MRVSRYFVPTRKEIPKEAEIPSHRMMLRAGLIRQHAAGVYSILPMGWRVLTNIMRVIREEMDRIGCQEFFLPALSPGELWKKSGRWETFGDDMFRLKDRKNRDLCLAPTHEEVFTEIAAADIRSYRDMPQMWYQIQTKFRDEVRPRSGLLRMRQFLMKDAYSFDATPEGLDESYRLQRDAYLRIFERVGLKVNVVRASSGAMGGRDCEEFVVLSESGDDQIVNCPACGYAANQEVAESWIGKVAGEREELRKVHTPDKRTIDQVSAFLGVSSERLVKSLVYRTAEGFAFVLVRGDHQVDEGKCEAALGESRPAEPEEVRALAGADIGFVSPFGLTGVRVLADPVLEGTTGLVAGANENDFHLLGVDMERDIPVNRYVPLRAVQQSDPCARCGMPLDVSRAIEVGHIFKLGIKYSKSLHATYLDPHGKEQYIVMGCYGIGVGRTVAAAIEQNHDKDGIIFPLPLAPFQVIVIPVNVKDTNIRDTAFTLYQSLAKEGLEVLIDDRDERPGIKFKDADLIGIPIRITVGAKARENSQVDIKVRKTGQMELVQTSQVIEKVKGIMGAL